MNILPVTLGVGQGVVQTVRPYFELFREDGFAPALSLALLVAAAIFGAFFLLRYVLVIRWSLWRQTRFVGWTRGYEAFGENFEAVDTSLSRSRLLRHAWNEFKETLILPSSARNEDKIIYNTTRPHDYFNTHETGLQFRFYRALPRAYARATGASKCCVQNKNRRIKSSPSRCAG